MMPGSGRISKVCKKKQQQNNTSFVDLFHFVTADCMNTSVIE